MVIRPLVYVGEDEARAYAKECALPIIGCCCPACGDLGLQRQRTKRLLMELEREHPTVKQSMLKALGNVAPRHLLDTRLNPPAQLRATATAETAPPTGTATPPLQRCSTDNRTDEGSGDVERPGAVSDATVSSLTLVATGSSPTLAGRRFNGAVTDR